MLPRLMSYAALASLLRETRERLDAHRSVLVCIDGPGGSGKSTIARELANAADDIQVVAQDDFYRPSAERFSGPPSLCPHGADFDLARLRLEVLEPLRQGRAAEYRVYDWDADALTGVIVPVTKPIVVVEGVYSSSAAQRSFFDVTLWVESPRDRRLARGLARDGEAARARWELDWMPKEDRYMEEERPREQAGFVCDGSRGDLAAGVLVLEMREPSALREPTFPRPDLACTGHDGPMSPCIRELREADFGAVRERVDLWWGRPVQDALPKLFFEHFLTMSRAAEADGEVVGFIVGFQSQTQPSVAYAHFIGVAPEYRNRGLARTLYELFFEAARARGCGTVEAITAPINGGSIAFHRRLGFEVLPSSTLVEGVPVSVDHDGPGKHRVRFRRSL